MDGDLQTILYVAGVIFAATLIRSTIGFGEALIAVPLLALRIPITEAAPLAVAISVIVAGVILVQDWRHVQFRSALWLVVSSLFGIPLGLLLLAKGNDSLVRSLLGLTIIAFSVYSLTAKTRLHLKTDRRPWLLLAGFVSGILGGAYGMNGPPLAVYGALRRWSPQHFRATLQGYFLPVSLAGLLGYAALGLWSRQLTIDLLISLPGTLLATVLGRSLNARIRGTGFLTIVYVGLIVIGGILLIQALMESG
jgi:uncharacterized membrane protein YfcA